MIRLNKTLSLLVIVSIITFSAVPLFAQDSHSIHRYDKIRLTYILPARPLPEKTTVNQKIKHNKSVDFSQITGTFVKTDNEAIFINTKINAVQMSFSLASLLKIEKSSPKPKPFLKSMFIGFTVGTLIGTAIWNAASLGEVDDVARKPPLAESVLGGSIIGGLPGLAAGARIANRFGSHWIEIPLVTIKR